MTKPRGGDFRRSDPGGGLPGLTSRKGKRPRLTRRGPDPAGSDCQAADGAARRSWRRIFLPIREREARRTGPAARAVTPKVTGEPIPAEAGKPWKSGHKIRQNAARRTAGERGAVDQAAAIRAGFCGPIRPPAAGCNLKSYRRGGRDPAPAGGRKARHRRSGGRIFWRRIARKTPGFRRNNPAEILRPAAKNAWFFNLQRSGGAGVTDFLPFFGNGFLELAAPDEIAARSGPGLALRGARDGGRKPARCPDPQTGRNPPCRASRKNGLHFARAYYMKVRKYGKANASGPGKVCAISQDHNFPFPG